MPIAPSFVVLAAWTSAAACTVKVLTAKSIDSGIQRLTLFLLRFLGFAIVLHKQRGSPIILCFIPGTYAVANPHDGKVYCQCMCFGMYCVVCDA